MKVLTQGGEEQLPEILVEAKLRCSVNCSVAPSGGMIELCWRPCTLHHGAVWLDARGVGALPHVTSYMHQAVGLLILASPTPNERDLAQTSLKSA